MDKVSKQVTVSIDGRACPAAEGETILAAARRNGIRIPTLCHHPALSSWGGCRLCVVEVDANPKLVASCVMPVRDGMSIVTANEAIVAARRLVLEFLFAERNHYCMFCARSGECELQQLAYELQMDHLTVPQSFETCPVDITSEDMAIDHNRCVLCGRCVRACHEIAGAYVLHFQNRGARSRITFDLNVPRGGSSCLGCGVCMQLCPTGALFDRHNTHLAVKGHSKSQWTTLATFCSRCGLMCTTRMVVRDDQLLRVEGDIDAGRQGLDRGQLCARGRFGPLKQPGRRLLQPMARRNGAWREISWKAALDEAAQGLNGAGEGLFGLASEQCSNEQLMLFRDLVARGWGARDVGTLGGRLLHNICAAWADFGKSVLVAREAPLQRIAEADHIFLAGVPDFASQPLIGGLVRRLAIEKKVPVTILGQVDPMLPWSTHIIPVEAGKEGFWVKMFLAEVLKNYQGPALKPALELVAAEMAVLGSAQLDAPPTFYKAAELFAASRQPIVVAGSGLTAAREWQGLRDLMFLSLVKRILPENRLRLVILKPGGNSAGALKLGIAAGLRDNAPRRRGFVLLEDDDLSELPGPEPFAEAEFLAVMTPFFPEALAQKAHLLIPKTTALEEEGSYTSLDGESVRSRGPLLKRPASVAESYQTLLALLQRTDFHPLYSRWKDVSRRAMDEIGEAG